MPNDAAIVSIKFEPFILHAECLSLNAARKLFQIAMESGYRNSGISISGDGENTRYMVAVRSTLHLDSPIGYVLNDDPNTLYLHVDECFTSWVLKLIRDKFVQNDERLQKFVSNLKQLDHEPVHIETKEERWQRKRAEGLKRAQEIRGS